MRSKRLRIAVMIASLAALLAAPTTAQGDDTASLRRALTHQHEVSATAGATGGAQRAALERNLSVVGHIGFDPFAISDVWAHGGYAYVGGLGGTPVQVVDISDPANPTVAATIASPDPDCSSQDVKADRINTPYFKGDLLVVAGEGCFTGLQLYDINDPTNPELLAAVSDVGQPEFIHNAYIFEQGNRAYVAAVSGFNELFTPFGDVLIVDVTDPTNPTVVGDWGAGKDGGLAFGTPGVPVPPFPPGSDCTPPPGGEELCRGEFFPAVYAHDIWVNTQGTVAYVSYWDAGLILLDVSDPANPTMIGRGPEPATFGSDEGDAHVAVPARGGNLVIVGDETFTPDPFGFVRVFDTRDPSNPVQVGAYATENALNEPSAEVASYSAHNIVVRGNRAFVSWYDDGVRVLDFSQPRNPREIAAFAPGTGSFWGVYVHRNLVLGTDFASSGLYILQMKK